MLAKAQAQRVTVSDLLEKVGEIAPVLESGANESEAECHLAASSVEALHEAGFFKLWWPEELGGTGAGLADGVAVIEALAEVDTSSAWNVAVGTTHDGFAGAYLPEHAVETIFADERVVIAGQMAPVGQVERVNGGLKVSGRWSFGSGIHQATWVLGGVMLRDENDAAPAVVFAPIEQAQVDEQSWKVAGLSGTGSCDYTMTDVHIPDGFWFSFPAPMRLRGGSVFDLSIPAQTIILHAAFPLGVARRSLREITELAKTKIRAFSKNSVGQRVTFHRDLAEAEAKLAAARLYVHDVARRTDAASPAEQAPLHLEGRSAARYATDVALDIATWAFRAGGGTSLRLNNILQRNVRDLMAASQHIFVDDVAYTGYGAHLLELQS